MAKHYVKMRGAVNLDRGIKEAGQCIFPPGLGYLKLGQDSPRLVQNLHSQMEAQQANSFFILFVYRLLFLV